MEMNEKRPDMHPIVDVDGFIADGKQFDLDITLANDRRNVIFGVVRDNFKEPVKDDVKHIKICVKTRKDLNCLKGIALDCDHTCDCDHDNCDRCNEDSKLSLKPGEE